MDTISAVVTEGLKLKEFITECSQLSIVTICQILWVSYTLVGFVTLNCNAVYVSKRNGRNNVNAVKNIKTRL